MKQTTPITVQFLNQVLANESARIQEVSAERLGITPTIKRPPNQPHVSPHRREWSSGEGM